MLLFEREREEKVKRKGDKEMQISWPGGMAQPRLASQPKNMRDTNQLCQGQRKHESLVTS